MSKPGGGSDDESAVPAEIDAPRPSHSAGPLPSPVDEFGVVPMAIDLPLLMLDDELSSPAADDELFARDALAAAQAGNGHVEILMCARALRADAGGDAAAALTLWKAAFEREPTLLVAFWGLRRALVRRAAWADLVGIIDRRLAALVAFGDAAAPTRADLWFQRARVEEDHLRHDEEAARSLRAGLAETPEHQGLLMSLLVLGFRRSDAAACVDALTGVLRGTLPPALRASATAWLAGLERRTASDDGGGAGEDLGAGAARALHALQAALRTVGREHAGPLLDELSRLARTAASPATRAAILGEVIAQTGAAGGKAEQAGEAARVVALERERARLLRGELGDSAAAINVLRQAVARAPDHPLVLAELADQLEAPRDQAAVSAESGAPGQPGAEVLRDLQDLLNSVSPGSGGYASEAERELALRVVTALGRQGRAADALAILERHPELPAARPDVFALEVILRAMLGDASGLTRAFEGLAGRLLASNDAEPSTGAATHALVVAGALAEMEWQRTAGGAVREPGGEDSTGEDDDLALRLYRRAVEIAPDDRAAEEALERRLWTTGRWSHLAEVLIARFDRLDGVASAGGERARLLEDLVAVHRDLLDDPAAALVCQDHLLAELAGVGAPEQVTRAWVRRLDLDWRARDRARTGAPSNAREATRIVETFRALAERAESPAPAAAFRIAGARAAAAAGNLADARALFTAAAPDDLSGAAAAGLERLAGATAGGDDGVVAAAAAEVRLAVVRDELARVDQAAPNGDGRVRSRALRFRLAWHALAAHHADAALEALGPLDADGDPIARAWSWEIARRAGDPRLALRILRATSDAPAAGSHPGPIWAPVDLAEAMERAGDLRGAETAFRHAHEQEPSTDAALGLLRVATARGNGPAVLEATRALAALADAQTGRLLSREATMLELLAGTEPAATETIAAPHSAPPERDDPAELVLGWMRGTRTADPVGAAGGLLALARALPTSAPEGKTDLVPDLAIDRLGLLARAAARARIGGTALAGAVHDQVQTLSSGSAPIGVGLADLPMGGRPERGAARRARAERNAGALSYALELERGLDAEARGDGRAALEGFARALTRDGDGIEALDGIKRVALASGDRAGAARAGTRLGMVLRTPARAAAELGMAAQIWVDLGRPEEASIAFWQALARDPRSPWLFERLRELLAQRHDWAGLDLLFGHRLAATSDERARVTLLMERAQHRLGRMGDRKAAIDDLKRVVKIDPDRRAALRMLATLATEMEYFRQAVRFLARLLGLTTDEEQAAALRLELAEAHESAREPARAVEVLREAVSARARDPVPWQRLIDLLLRLGDWAAALATLRSWDAIVAEPVPKAAVWLRIGALLRDHGRDLAGAAAAFTTAAELDPLGDGIQALVALHDQAGAHTARSQAIEGGIAAMRAALANDPLDIPRLGRLRELHEWSAAQGSADGNDAATVVGQVLALAGEDVNAPATRRADSRTPFSAEFWTRIRAPGASDTALAIWPHLAAAAAELSPVPKGRVPARERVAPSAEPRLTWVEAAAAAVGVSDLELALAKPGTFAGDPGDTSVILVEGGHPTLVVGRGLLAGDAAARFRIGRALGLLRDRATVLDRIAAPAVASTFAAGAVVAGAPAPALVIPPSGSAVAADERARLLGRAMSRKDRKALELEASRFGFETIDAAAFQSALLGTADRLGLLFAGDVAVAVRLVADLSVGDRDPSPPRPMLAVIRENPRALALLRFALSQDYLTARREMGQGRAERG